MDTRKPNEYWTQMFVAGSRSLKAYFAIMDAEARHPHTAAFWSELANAMWDGGGDRLPALKAWADRFGVPWTYGHVCPRCNSSGVIYEAVDINAIASVTVPAPCPVCNVITEQPAADDTPLDVLP